MKTHKQNGTAVLINAQKGFRIHLLVFLLTVPALWIIWYFTDRTYLWPLWQTGAWATGVIFHFLGAFVFKKSKKHYYLA